MSIDPGRNKNPGAFTEARARKATEAVVHAELLAVAEASRDWMERALCAQTDPEAFYPEKGATARDAKEVCGRCPVAAECLEYALTNGERWGTWGGKTERERAAMKRNQPRKNQRDAARDLLAQKVRGLTSEGRTDPETAVWLGISERTVARIRKDYGIAPHPFNAGRGPGVSA